MKLSCQSIADLEVASACLQDAITRLCDMRYESKARRFIMVLSRYQWELNGSKAKGAGGMRTRCGIHINDVLNVAVQGIDQSDRDGLLALLSLTATEKEDSFEIILTFAGQGTIRLQAECIDFYLSDQGHPWHTDNRPDHDL